MRMLFLLFVLLYVGGNVYIFVRALQQFGGCMPAVKIVFSVLYWLVVFLLVIAMATRQMDVPLVLAKSMYVVGTAWLAFTLYMLFALLLADGAHWLIPAFHGGFWCALAATCCLLVYGYWHYRHPDVNAIDISVDKPLKGGGLKIVAVSDVHLGYGTGKAALGRYVDLINAQQPDLIVIGGDLIDNSVAPLYRGHFADELARLKAPMGIYMVPGNHEYISGIEASERFLRDTPITLLRDSVVTLPDGLQIIGRDDRSNRSRRPLTDLWKQVNPSLPVLLLDHQPYHLARTDSLGIDVQFSGHTHHGQLWPASWVTDKIYEQSHGYRQWSHSHIYVSSGLSIWGPPFRIGTSSDMAVLFVHSAK